MTDSLESQYRKFHAEILSPIAPRLESLIKDHLSSLTRIDRIYARAKSPERFLEKASKKNENGIPKYENPLRQIQDQLGARVIVFYKSDVDPASDLLKKYLIHIEEQLLVPENESSFGYFGKHFVFALPTEAIPKEIKPDVAPSFFELQIKTLFQHAWSEADHDLGYKPSETLNTDQKRKLAFTAAQAWGADMIFQELFEELVISLAKKD
ncbi:RelA/SpoT domain-containing protein [bacterium]|nr:RelA/SpoT domain-containing protein [bacterium]